MKKFLRDIFEEELKKGSLGPYFDITNSLLPLIDYIARLDCLPTKEYSIKNAFPFSYAEKYIKEKHLIYYSEFIRMWQENQIHVGNYPSDNAECDSYTGEIWLGRNENILDDLNLVHEFFHHQNLIPINKGGKNPLVRDLFGEAISIMAQLDFANSLKESGFYIDANVAENNYLNDCIECAKKIRVELILIELYKSKGEVTEEFVKYYISQCEDENLSTIIIKEYENILSSIGGWGANFKFPFNLRHFLGVIIGCYLSDLVIKDSRKWEDIYNINNHFYEIKIGDFLSKMEIEFESGNLLSIFMKHFERVKIINDNSKKK